MQVFEINRFIEINQWISGAAVSPSSNDSDSGLLQLDLSAEGHRLICEQGIQVFSKKITEVLDSMSSREEHWQFRPVQKEVFDRLQPAPQYKLPAVISKVDGAGQHSFLLEVSPEMDVFEGHFPDNPILPGIVQLHWAIAISMVQFSFFQVPLVIKRLKFKNIVQPPAILELVLSKSGKDEIQFQLNSAGQVHSLGCFVVEEELSC